MDKFYLINKQGGYALGRYTDTELSNHKRFGWIVVKFWKSQPTSDTIKAAIAIDQWHTEELNRERVSMK